jgi:hypothetical protein
LEEDLGRGSRIILKLILRKWVGKVWTGLIFLSIMTSFCEYGD